MKKLFYAFLFAAASLMVSCDTPDNGGTGGTQEPEFYGYEMTAADVAAIGNNEYILQMYIIDEETSKTQRLLSAHFTAADVTDGVIPEGTYQLQAGTIGDNGAYIKGSYYENNTTANPYMVLITDAELEIKHTADGSRATVWADGVNAKDGSAINDIECRYTGAIEYYTTSYPSVKDSAALVYYGALAEGLDYWQVQFDINEELYMNLYFNVASGSIDNGIPSGKYAFDFTSNPGTADATYQSSNGGYGGSMMIILYQGSSYIYHFVMGGEVNLTNNGDGSYKFDVVYYNDYYIPYTVSYEGTTKLYDYSTPTAEEVEIDNAILLCKDGSIDWWYIYLQNESFYNGYGLQFYFDITGAAGDTFEHGLTSGEYGPSANYDPQTYYPGEWYEEDGEIVGMDGSAVITMPLNEQGQCSVYDIINSGKLTITNNGDGTYKFDVNISGESAWVATWEGTPQMVDATTSEEPAAVARKANKAPLKSAEKVVLTKEFDKDATFQPLAGRNVRF